MKHKRTEKHHGKGKGRQYRNVKDSKVAQESYLSWKVIKFLMFPVVVAAIIAIGFPEILQFSSSSLNFFTSKSERGESLVDSNDAENKTEVQPLSAANFTQEVDDVPPEVRDFKPTYQKSFAAKKIFLEGRRIAPIELLPQKNVTSNDVRLVCH